MKRLRDQVASSKSTECDRYSLAKQDLFRIVLNFISIALTIDIFRRIYVVINSNCKKTY